LGQKPSTINVYNALALPNLLYESEIWTLRQKDKKWLTSIEMQFFRTTAGYTLFEHKRNKEILEELTVEPVDKKLRTYRSNWLRHVTRTNNNRMTKVMVNCRLNVRTLSGHQGWVSVL
jgi:hypothetical protein